MTSSHVLLRQNFKFSISRNVVIVLVNDNIKTWTGGFNFKHDTKILLILGTLSNSKLFFRCEAVVSDLVSRVFFLVSMFPCSHIQTMSGCNRCNSRAESNKEVLTDSELPWLSEGDNLRCVFMMRCSVLMCRFREQREL